MIPTSLEASPGVNSTFLYLPHPCQNSTLLRRLGVRVLGYCRVYIGVTCSEGSWTLGVQIITIMLVIYVVFCKFALEVLKVFLKGSYITDQI